MLHVIFHSSVRRQALTSLTRTFADILPVRQQLLDRLDANLDSIVLQGSLILDLSFVAHIPTTVIGDASYGDITTNITVNRFEAAASLGSSSLSLDLPVSLQSGNGTIFNFGLTEATFALDYFAELRNPVHIIDLFSEDHDTSITLDFGGTFDAILPMTVGIADTNVGVDLTISIANLFAPNPVIDYAFDLCDISETITDLFGQLKEKIVSVIESPFQDLVIAVNIDKITDTLVEKVDAALSNFTDGMNVAVGSECSRRLEATGTERYLSPTQTPVSLVETIQNAISSVNTILESAGIKVSAETVPFFNGDTFSAGVSVNLSATIDQTAAEALELVSQYIEQTTNPNSTTSNLGLPTGTSNDTLFDVSTLMSKVSFGAGLDVSFGVELNLVDIQDGIFASYPFSDALQKGISLYIDTWGAFGQVIVDPIEIGMTLFGTEIKIRDSYFYLAAELRSRGRFIASIDEMMGGDSDIDTAPLTPVLTVPFSSEFVFDVNATDELVVSPIISAGSADIVRGNFNFDFDVDLNTFLNSDYVGTNNLMSVLENATVFLQQIESLSPELKVGDTPSPLDGLFSIVDSLIDLGDGLMTYIEIVNEGMCVYAELSCLLY